MKTEQAIVTPEFLFLVSRIPLPASRILGAKSLAELFLSWFFLRL